MKDIKFATDAFQMVYTLCIPAFSNEVLEIEFTVQLVSPCQMEAEWENDRNRYWILMQTGKSEFISCWQDKLHVVLHKMTTKRNDFFLCVLSFESRCERK